MRRGTPKAEIVVTPELVRILLQSQHPDLADLALVAEESGWDNWMFRLGDELLVRLPRRAIGAQLLENEQNWLPSLANHLPLSVPVPLRIGEPADGFPWKWSVMPWIEGSSADLSPPDSSQGQILGSFLNALHQSAPENAPFNSFRSVPLLMRKKKVQMMMASLELIAHPVSKEIRTLWSDALKAPIDMTPTWIHGDMHARNVLTLGSKLTAVIDWGDMAQGDRSVDLASIWMLLPDKEARRQARETCAEITLPTWIRAKGWAVLFALMLMDAGAVDDQRLFRAGRVTLDRLSEDITDE